MSCSGRAYPPEDRWTDAACFRFLRGTIFRYTCYYGGHRILGVIIPANFNGDDVTTIRREAFRHNRLTSISFPNSLTTIKHYAFNDNQLTSVSFPDSVTTIDR